MLDLSTAVLCDFAQVRDRLLFVASGAVSRLYRQELPSPLGLMVGLVIEVPLEDAGMEHTLRAEVINRHGTVLAELQNLFRVSDEGLFPHEVQQVPLVLSITGVRARTWGTHQVRLYLDDELVRALTLYVVPAAGTAAAVQPAPTQSRAEQDAVEASLGGAGTGGVDAAPTDDAGDDADDAGDAGLLLDFDLADDILFDLEDDGEDEPAAPAEPAGPAPFLPADPIPDPSPAPVGEPAPPLVPAFGAEAPLEPAFGAGPPATDEGTPDDPEPAGAQPADAEDDGPPTQPVPTQASEGPEAASTADETTEAPAPPPPAGITIDAPRAAEGSTDDSADAAADGGGADTDPEPAPPAEAPPSPKRSRFSFRYRYEDDEDESS